MNSRPVRQMEKEIQERFFKAIESLVSAGKIRGLKTICKEYGLHEARYIKIRKSVRDNTPALSYRFIDIDAPAYLVRDYSLSAEWMLTGKGKMFK